MSSNTVNGRVIETLTPPLCPDAVGPQQLRQYRDHLQACSAFARLPAQHLATLAALARPHEFVRGHLLLKQNRPIVDCYAILSGRIRLELHNLRGRSTPIQTLSEGELLGWSWLSPPYHSHFDARAMTAVSTLALDTASLRNAMAADPVFGYALYEALTPSLIHRLQNARLQLSDAYAHPNERRA